MQAAAWAWQTDPPAHARLLDALDARAASGEPVAAVAAGMVRETLAPLWAHGWTPADLVHTTAHTLSASHADVVAAAVVADGRARQHDGQAVHPRWRAQLDVLASRHAHRDTRAPDGARVCQTVTALAWLRRLPAVPPIVPPPGSPDVMLSDAGRLDQRMLARVRALLAKAESTEFDEEAEALTAKAQQLITRHAIADALLQTPDDVGEPSQRRIHLDAPYVDAKAVLLSEIADANRATAVHVPLFAWVTVFGYDRDLDAVELLAASLLVQATSAMARHGARRDVSSRSTTTSFRRAFLTGFAIRIGERLRKASDTQVATATDTERRRLLPVLTARDDRVRAAQEAAFPETVSRTTSVSNAAGWAAGQAAADVADLDVSAGHLGR